MIMVFRSLNLPVGIIASRSQTLCARYMVRIPIITRVIRARSAFARAQSSGANQVEYAPSSSAHLVQPIACFGNFSSCGKTFRPSCVFFILSSYPKRISCPLYEPKHTKYAVPLWRTSTFFTAPRLPSTVTIWLNRFDKFCPTAKSATTV